jgi:hypothetical protein
MNAEMLQILAENGRAKPELEPKLSTSELQKLYAS